MTAPVFLVSAQFVGRQTFLLFQDTEVTGWSRALANSRSAYSSLREHLLRFIENPDEVGSAQDPLDDDETSPWKTMRQDEEIRAEIYQDVERCMPDEEYFRKPRTQRMLLDILFVFCKINQDVGYRQGMHEVLAPILWVVEQDALNSTSYDQSTESDADTLMKEVLDPVYIEHDAFTLLSLVMRSAKSFYELGDPDRKSNIMSTATGTPQQAASPIVERSRRIHEVYLASLDPELAKHLTDIEILPQIFLIRWIRLLFGREFPFDELLTMWDTLFAEDPALDLVDMVCVAMLLRIRWQLIEANYSIALMLLLKYPSPISPHGPRTFVDDAIYLRDNLNVAGGAQIISKYGAKPVQLQSPASQPSTPSGRLSPRQRLPRQIASPARFLQQQGGVEALFQEAAKGVLERGERLGINQAVRDAVGEVRKNMQGLQTSRSNSTRSRTSEGARWSLDEGRTIHPSKANVSAMNARNQQLALMLDAAMADLRAVSVSKDSDKEACVKAMDLAIAKVDFVKIYLEDSTMPLLPDSPQLSATSPPPASPQPILHGAVPVAAPKLADVSTAGARTQKASADDLLVSPALTPDPLSSVENQTIQKSQQELPARPKEPVPTRSSIAQSSFSWMLEPERPSSLHKSSPPQPPSPFQKSGRRPTSGPGREKAAFLFGEDGEGSGMTSARLPPLGDGEEGFHLGTIERGGKLK
ncbi:Ypt of gyp1p [Venustampulla echinocandica]|uniref:Ypt of gyp1p n=1 Tax=Venustampulla echinocandica TaxID=2656787 RepID=A0A370TYK7_9HELO|nr:Ypt of gyp1p [Venustampulla echinocandica]RDL40603.1 Ypt of gyp1p [Venustampulla echinocandica]